MRSYTSLSGPILEVLRLGARGRLLARYVKKAIVLQNLYMRFQICYASGADVASLAAASEGIGSDAVVVGAAEMTSAECRVVEDSSLDTRSLSDCIALRTRSSFLLSSARSEVAASTLTASDAALAAGGPPVDVEGVDADSVSSSVCASPIDLRPVMRL